MADPFELSLAQAAHLIRDGQLSPAELMESLLSRSRSTEPHLRVWVTLDENAAMAAATSSAEDLQRGGPSGPLHGVPIAVKDIYYTRGLRTTACSPIYADFVPAYDATAVARLKQVGAIVMGKTVTTEFACMDPPPTRNPWDHDHTPGGSSSGSAVGVAARVFPAALGSQTAGSVVRPAAFNATVGFKPTFGRISRYGVMPVAWSLDTTGFFTRTVDDAAIMLKALSGYDPKDPSSVSRAAPDYQEASEGRDSPPRIGLVRHLFHHRATPEARDHMEGVVRRLGAAGAEIEEAGVPFDFEALLGAHKVIMASEAASVHEADFRARPEDYGPKVRSLIEAGMLTPAVTYLQAQRVRRRFREVMEQTIRSFDILLTPSAPGPAPRDLTTTGDPSFQAPWTTCGFPVLALPSGLSESGLPLSIQLVSAPFAEARLLAAAHWCEKTLNVKLAPPEQAGD